MKTTNNFETMVKEANAQTKSFDGIPSKILNAMNDTNQEIVSALAKSFVNDSREKFFEKTMLVSLPKECNDVAISVYNAISVEIYTIAINDSGLLELSKVTKALTFKDFYQAKLDLLSFGNADKKPTPQNKIDCNQYFFSENGLGLIQCLLFSATECKKLDNMKLEKNANLIKAYEVIAKKYQDLKKDNPFDGNSETKHTLQLKEVYNNFVGDTFEKLANKYHYQAIIDMLVTFNKKAVFTIQDEKTAMQALTIIARYIYNKKQFTIKDKAKILTK